MANQRDYPRSARFNPQIRAELVDLLRSSLIRDPRVSGVDLSITSVETSSDLGQANVWMSSLADDETLAKAVQGLNHAAGKLRHEVGLRLHIRYVPVLRFLVDEATREGDRVTALIRKAVARDLSQTESGDASNAAEPLESKPE